MDTRRFAVQRAAKRAEDLDKSDGYPCYRSCMEVWMAQAGLQNMAVEQFLAWEQQQEQPDAS
jgi:hypothetical protein